MDVVAVMSYFSRNVIMYNRVQHEITLHNEAAVNVWPLPVKNIFRGKRRAVECSGSTDR